uniref:Period circadian protein n=1 Tax=Ceratosolen solmsi marchali TaxID=326594 RepID=A0A0G2QUP4_9HYME|nr:PER [Ceratosolen solmsi marchali]
MPYTSSNKSQNIFILCWPIEEEATVVELVDATDSGVHNNNLITSAEGAGLTSKIRPIDDITSHSTDEFYAVISMDDGLVLHASASLYTSLGYPIDWWTGKLFIDFLNPRDKYIFTDRIASEIAISRDFHPSGANGRKASIFCRLRRFNICVSTNDQYVPYRINLVVQNFHDDKMTVSQSHVMLLVASFQSVQSAYKVPQETIIPTVFTTRHTATCRLSYVDPEVVQYLGYLPQDMIDRSLFDFYYPEDLPLIKEIYKIVINLESKTFKSKPYRFMIQNGSFVVLETEWSSFINPWTKSVEFVVGQHKVREGPVDPDIFHPPGNRRNDLLANISDEVMKEAQIIQKEIVSLLVEDVQRKLPSKATDFELLSKKKELKSFAQYILQEIKSPATIKDQMALHDRSFSGHDSVMLGEISPHHEYLDSKSSTETPPSYNQLNYQDNIERFFNRSIGVSVNNRPYASDEDILHSSENSSDALGKNNSSGPELKCSFSTNESGNSGSAENLSSESTNQQSFGSRGETSNATSNDKLLILTESLLYKHNEDMEKLMLQKHCEQKKGDKRNNSTSLNDHKAKAEQPTLRCGASNKNRSRLKRSGGPIGETDNNIKVLKYDNSVKELQSVGTVLESLNTKPNVTTIDTSPITTQNCPKTNAWTPNSVIMPSTTTIAQQRFTTTNAYCQGVSRFPTLPQWFPVYYLPLPQIRDIPSSSIIPQEHPGPPSPINQFIPYYFFPVTYTMPSVIYPPIVGAHTPPTMMCRPFPFIVPETTATPLSDTCPTTAHLTTMTTTSTATATVDNSFDPKQPVSRETSIKAEPGSIITISESSKKRQKSNESSDNQTFKTSGMTRKEPPWIEGIPLTSELINQYQMKTKPLHDVLKTDLEFLSQSKQSNLVNDQLRQLYLDIDLKNFSSNLLLEDPGTSSANEDSSDESHSESKLWWNNLKEDVPGEQQCKIKDCKFAPLGHRAHPLFQRNYCGQEMKLIIQYLNYYDVIHSGKGFCVWEDMHSRGYMRHRTVQSLNNNFKKILLRDIEVFQLPQSLEDKFLELRHISASDRKGNDD